MYSKLHENFHLTVSEEERLRLKQTHLEFIYLVKTLIFRRWLQISIKFMLLYLAT